MIMKVLAFTLLLLFYFGSMAAFAETQVCEQRMISVQSVRHFQDYNPHSPIKFESTLSFELGGELNVARRVGAYWHSSYAKVDRAPEGDPRLFVLVFGSRTAYYFGYRQLAEDVITLPGAIAINKSISELNANELKNNSLPMSFYDAEGIVDDITFLKNLTKFKLPIGKDSHDHAFHTALMQIPPEDFMFAIAQMEHVLEFMEWSEQKIGGRVWFKALVRTLTEFLVDKLDVGFGDTVGNVGIRSILGLSSQDLQYVEQIRPDFALLFNDGLSAEFVLKDFAHRAFDILVKSGFKIEPREKIELHNLITEFNGARPAQRSREDLKISDDNMMKFYKRMAVRRGEIAKAVVEAQKRLLRAQPL